MLALQEEKLRVCITKVLSSLSFFNVAPTVVPTAATPPALNKDEIPVTVAYTVVFPLQAMTRFMIGR